MFYFIQRLLILFEKKNDHNVNPSINIDIQVRPNAIDLALGWFLFWD